MDFSKLLQNVHSKEYAEITVEKCERLIEWHNSDKAPTYITGVDADLLKVATFLLQEVKRLNNLIREEVK